MAVLLRANSMMTPFEKIFCRLGIPYCIPQGYRLLERVEARVSGHCDRLSDLTCLLCEDLLDRLSS